MKSIKLEIADSPIVTLQYQAYTLCSLLYDKNCLPWFYSNYINLYCNNLYFPNKKELAVNFLSGSIFGGIPLLKHHEIKKSVIKNTEKELNYFIKNCLNKNYFFYTFIDEFFIPNRIAYNNTHFSHDIMIYGCNPQNGSYNVLGYDASKKFRESIVKYNDFGNAFSNYIENAYDTTVIFKKKENVNYGLNINKIITSLNDYINSSDCSEKLQMYYDSKKEDNYEINNCKYFKNEKIIFGMDIYKHFKLYLEALQCGKIRFDIRSFHCLYEHKKCMVLRIKYLEKNNILNNAKSVYDEYIEIEKMTIIVRNYMIKYSITNDDKIIKRVVNLLDKIEFEEFETITRLIKNIKN